MPGLVPGIHVLLAGGKDVDGRDKPGHDEACGQLNPPTVMPGLVPGIHVFFDEG